jgi:hypothetical protein
MRRGEASGAKFYFRLIVFGNRAMIAARSFLRFANFAKSRFANSLKSTNRKSPKNESRKCDNENLKTRAQIGANGTELCGPLRGSARIGGKVRVSEPNRAAPCQ